MAITIKIEDGAAEFYPVNLDPIELFMTNEDFIKLRNSWGVFLNDTWYWSAADFEEIPEAEYEQVAEIHRMFGRAGLYRWVYGKRGHYPAFDDNRDMIDSVINLEKLTYDSNGMRLK